MIKFGTDGWRAVISKDFTFANVQMVAQAIREYVLDMGEDNRGIVVGYDTRFLSAEYAKEVARVLASQHIKVYLTEEAVPTPVVSYAVVKKQTAGGIMITASHNPAIYNGIKFKSPCGGSASPAIVEQIEKKLAEIVKQTDRMSLISYEQGVEKGLISLFNPKESYLNHLKSFVNLDKIKDAGLKVIVDPMYGAGRNYLIDILEEAGINAKQIRSELNPGFAGINPEPIAKNLEALVQAVLDEGADVGLATDGDADRIGAVDSKGQFVDSHRIFALLLKHFVEEKKWQGEVVKTFSVSQMIDKLSKKYGLTLHEKPIGFKYICDLMQQKDILIGGEESGGIGVKGHLPERDGILCSLLLLEIMASKKKNLERILEDLMEEIGYHYYDRYDLHLIPLQKEKLLSLLQVEPSLALSDESIKEIQRIDGVKFFFNDGAWLLFRPSGTEPVVRLYSEASSPGRVQSLLKKACLLAYT